MRKLIVALLISFVTSHASAQHVEIKSNQLVVDQKPQPQLFGAEVQYFRLRGGYGLNVPRAKVIDLWNRALDKVVEAKMNSISFYIPWDFHEYAEGKFDFTGTVDEDGDGNPDYPSRDLITFFKLVEAHGIKRILVRPGPYINAEWGFLGFGAIPTWFHERHPESHMVTPWGWRTKLFDYLDPTFLEYTKKWFETLYWQVLRTYIGKNKPIIFLQLDNETNFQWGSIFTQDYGAHSIESYQSFLKGLYPDLQALNQTHNTNWADWTQIQPPSESGKNIAEDQDWYRFSDQKIFLYLQKIRNIWQNLGVSEPQVMFTLAESFNANPDGLLPNYKYRNSRGATGLMTVNLYPKTFESDNALLNYPFKADLDVKSDQSANNYYYGTSQEWTMGPEIQAGWWRGTQVSDKARLQTYLTVIGHGLKSFFVYYFNEGQNWQVEWAQKKIIPLFEALRREWHVESVPPSQLSNEFWGELQARSDRLILMGFDVRRLMQIDIRDDETLYFDSPLDAEAKPRDHFALLKKIGEQLIAPYQYFLSRSLEANDEIAIVKDSESHVPSVYQGVNSLWAAAEWSGGLLGYLLNSNLNPKILHADISAEALFAQPKVLTHIDTGVNSPRTLHLLFDALKRNQTVVNFLADDVAHSLGYGFKTTAVNALSPVKLKFYQNSQLVEIVTSGPVFTYDNLDKNCEGILFYDDQIAGYRCKTEKGAFVQVGALLFDEFNSSRYADMSQTTQLKQFMNLLLVQANVKPKLQLSDDASQAVAFARKDPSKNILWITVKTSLRSSQSLHLKIDPQFLRENLKPTESFLVSDLLSQQSQSISFSKLTNEGFEVYLESEGSTVFVVTP